MTATLPKPLNGWREFAGEVGIIVLGVLIALGFGQLAEAWNWRSNTHQAVDDLKAERATNFALMAERVVVQPCIDAQLDRLTNHVLSAEGSTKPLPPIDSTIGIVAFRQPIDRPFQDDVWRSLIADGTASHFDRDGRQQMAGFYWQIDSMRELQKRGDADVGKLNVLLSPMPIDTATRAALLTTIADARFAGYMLTLDAAQSMAMLKSMGQQPPDARVDGVIAAAGTVQYCRAQHLPLADWRARLRKEYSDGGYQPRRLI